MEKNKFIIFKNLLAIISIIFGAILTFFWLIQSMAMYSGGGMYIRPFERLIIYIFFIVIGFKTYLSKFDKEETKPVIKSGLYLSFIGLLSGIIVTIVSGLFSIGNAHMEITYADYTMGWPLPWLVLYYPYEEYFETGRILFVNFFIDILVWSAIFIQFNLLICASKSNRLSILRNKIMILSKKTKKRIYFLLPLILSLILIFSAFFVIDTNNKMQREREINYWMEELNYLDKDSVDDYENGDTYEDVKNIVEKFKEELKKLGVTPTWDHIQEIYIIGEVNYENVDISEENKIKMSFEWSESNSVFSEMDNGYVEDNWLNDTTLHLIANINIHHGYEVTGGSYEIEDINDRLKLYYNITQNEDNRTSLYGVFLYYNFTNIDETIHGLSRPVPHYKQ